MGGLINRSPIQYAANRGNWWGGAGRKYGMAGQMGAMGASATLFSIVNRTSTAVAVETWHLHEKAPGQTCDFHSGEDDACDAKNVRNVERHPMLVPLADPNPFYSTSRLFESGQQHIDLTGEGWLIIARMGTLPAELWIARPDRMVVVTDPADFLTGYIYTAPDGREQPLRKEDVLPILMPNPLDPYRGLGPVQTIMTQVQGAQYSAEWNANFFRNGARPGGIVKLSRKMVDSEFEQLVERFNRNHLGVGNANRTAFLEDGEWIDPKPMSLADMQFVEQSNLSRDTILLAYGMSKFAVGVVEDVNRATADASANWFAETATVPRLDRWKDMLNGPYQRAFPGYVPGRYEFVYSSPVKEDGESARADKRGAADVFGILVRSGMAPTDAARIAGIPDDFTIVGPPVTLQPASAL